MNLVTLRQRLFGWTRRLCQESCKHTVNADVCAWLHTLVFNPFTTMMSFENDQWKYNIWNHLFSFSLWHVKTFSAKCIALKSRWAVCVHAGASVYRSARKFCLGAVRGLMRPGPGCPALAMAGAYVPVSKEWQAECAASHILRCQHESSRSSAWWVVSRFGVAVRC